MYSSPCARYFVSYKRPTITKTYPLNAGAGKDMAYASFSAGTTLQPGKLRLRNAVAETGGILFIGDGGESRNVGMHV